jgi:hypothetical protein
MLDQIGEFVPTFLSRPISFSLRILHTLSYSPGCLTTLAWEAEEFDCTVVVFPAALRSEELDAISGELVQGNAHSVVLMAPPSCVSLLDEKIEREVRLRGRRSREYPSGRPFVVLTVEWTPEDMVEDARLALGSWFGARQHTIVLVVGTPQEYTRFRDAARSWVGRSLMPEE